MLFSWVIHFFVGIWRPVFHPSGLGNVFTIQYDRLLELYIENANPLRRRNPSSHELRELKSTLVILSLSVLTCIMGIMNGLSEVRCFKQCSKMKVDIAVPLHIPSSTTRRHVCKN